MSNHLAKIRIYYEDTDSGGVVYNANYLKFAERARTEMLRDLGIIQSQLKDKYGILFVVKNANMELLSPARLDDLILIDTKITKLAGAAINMDQIITCNNINIANIAVKVACIKSNFKPTRLPKDIYNILKNS